MDLKKLKIKRIVIRERDSIYSLLIITSYRPQAAYKDSEEPTMPLHPFGLLLSKDGIVCMALVSIPWSYRFLPFPLQSITPSE